MHHLTRLFSIISKIALFLSPQQNNIVLCHCDLINNAYKRTELSTLYLDYAQKAEKNEKIVQKILHLQLGPTQVKCQLLNYDIFLNEFMTFSWKCHKLSSDIYENMSEIHNLKVNI